MVEAIYFDVRNEPSDHSLSGISLTINEIVAKAWSNNFPQAKAMDAVPSAEIENEIIKLNESRNSSNKKWIRVLRTLVLSVSGKTMSLADANMYFDLLWKVNKSSNNQFKSASGLLAYSYFVCGFDIKRLNWSESGVNNYSDAMQTLKAINSNKDLLNISSFMCAHREADDINKNTIVDSIRTQSFERVIKILKGYTYNANIKKINYTIYHISGDKTELSSLFPNIIANYLNNSTIETLITKLKINYQQIKDISEILSDRRINIEIVPLSKYILDIKRFCQSQYGTNWSQITDFTTLNDPIVSIAHNLTSNDVSRYMPEYENNDFVNTLKKYASNPNINYLMNVDNYSLHGKALFETVFYYLWGKITKSTGGIGIGIDRDHDLFQVQSFNLGYNNILDYSNGAGLLYMRRSSEEIGLTSLKSISLRQFWRYSDTKR